MCGQMNRINIMAATSSQKDTMLWITLFFYLISFTDFLSDYIPVSIAKVSIYLLAEVLIFYVYKRQTKFQRIDLVKYVMVPYLFLLFIRLCVDFVIPGKGFSIYGNSYTIVFFFFNAIVIPVFFYSKYRVSINLVSFCLVAGVIMSICFLLSLDQIIVESIAAASKGGQYDAGGHLDIISYGQYSSALSLIGLYLLFFHSKNKIIILISFVFIAIGLSGIVLSAARSAVVSLFVGALYLYISRFGSFKKILLGILLIVLLSSFFVEEIVKFGDYLEENGFYGFSRIVDTFFNGDEDIMNQTNGRDNLYKMGMSLFIENPIWGYAYLLPTGTYVHNIFIEQFMALGLIGGSFFVIMNLAIIKYSFIIAKHCPVYSIFSTLFIQNLIFGFFSLTIIGLTAYWLFLALVINTFANYKYEKRIGYNSNL